VTEQHDPDPQTEQHAPDPQTPTTFEELNLGAPLLEAIRGLGWAQPTEVQAKAIPPALQGRDLLVQSRTGSGKTAVFGVPFADQLVKPDVHAPQTLVLCPTRELALQVAEECSRIAAKTPLKILAIYGGAAMGPQVSALQDGAQIIVGTPGRILDHLRRGTLKTDAIHVLVLDECDEMLSMGFLEDITSIVDQLPAPRQTMLFSATIPDDIQKLTERYLKDPLRLYLSEDFIGVREIQHIYYLISGTDRTGDLLRVLQYENPGLALIFCNTRDDTAMVADFLRGKGFPAEGISSDLTQAERERVMQSMRDGNLRYLVATDIAARGIDLSDLTHVINYTFPESADIYVHRTGRTGRAGKSGIAVSLVSPREIGSFYYLKLIHKIYPEERHLPSTEEMATRREGERFARLCGMMEGKRVSEEMRSLARRAWSTLDGERLVALALAVVLDEGKEVFAEVVAPARSSTDEERRRDHESGSERPRREERGGRGERPRRREERGGRGERPRRREERGGRGERPRRREERGDRAPREESGDRAPREESGDRAPREEREAPAAPRERKTTRTRRRDVEPGERGGEQGEFTTPDGDVERWEVIDAEPVAGEPATDAVRMFINIGRRQGINEGELVDFIEREASGGGDPLKPGDVEMRDNHSYFKVRAALADAVLERLAGKSFQDRLIRVEKAKTR
jgi:ATP-dependent RNA helicase DeaD